MFIVKMGEGEIAELAYRLDSKGKLIKNTGDFLQPRNMRFRINTNELRESLGNPDFNEDEYLKKKRETINGKISTKILTTKNIPEANHDSSDEGHSSNVAEVDIFKVLDSYQELEMFFDGWENFNFF